MNGPSKLARCLSKGVVWLISHCGRPTKYKCSFHACLYASPSGSDQACP